MAGMIGDETATMPPLQPDKSDQFAALPPVNARAAIGTRMGPWTLAADQHLRGDFVKYADESVL